jgi:hypothetical protein
MNQVEAHKQKPALDESQWSYAIDPYGSKATIREKLITDEGVWINFIRVPRVDAKRNTWIEVIYSPASESIAGKKKVLLTYKCDTPLLIKLSQEHYGKDGDKSYAHYQIKLPASKNWSTQEVDFSSFSRPDWTPPNSKDYGIVLNKVNALYFTPSMLDEKGGEATLQLSSVKLLP